MIIHHLIAQHLRTRDNEDFYLLQARDAIRWIEENGIHLGKDTRAIDLGCGHGIFGAELVERGCNTVFADEERFLLPKLADATFERINLDLENIGKLGEYDLAICSNVYEHLSAPGKFIESIHSVLKPGGHLYLSWTNWLSPWGGHEFSPFHYLGSRRGHLIYDRIIGKPRNHTPHENLFPTYIGTTLEMIQRNTNLEVIALSPRYYTELAFLMHIPVLREFLAWNCAMLLRRK